MVFSREKPGSGCDTVGQVLETLLYELSDHKDSYEKNILQLGIRDDPGAL